MPHDDDDDDDVNIISNERERRRRRRKTHEDIVMRVCVLADSGPILYMHNNVVLKRRKNIFGVFSFSFVCVLLRLLKRKKMLQVSENKR